MRVSGRVLGLVLVAMACQPSTPPPALQLAQCAPTFEIVRRPPVVLRVGEVERLSFVVEAFASCDGVQREPENVDLALLDHNGDAISRTLETSQQRAGVYELRTTFTVPATSFVTVVLSAEPSIGRIRTDVLAGRVSTAPWQGFGSSKPCLGTIDGPEGVELCLTMDELRVASSGALISSQVLALAMTRSRAWVFSTGIAEAWRFDGGTPERAGSWEFPIVPTSVHARGTRVIVAGVAETASATLTQFDEDAPPTRDVEVRGANLIDAVQFVTADDVQFGYGERLEIVDVAKLGAFVQVPQSVRASVKTVSAEGIWTMGRNGLDFEQALIKPDGGTSRVRLGPGLTLRPAPLPLCGDMVPLSEAGALQTTQGQPVLAVPVGAVDGGLELRFLQLSPQISPRWASTRWVFVTGPDGGLLRTAR